MASTRGGWTAVCGSTSRKTTTISKEVQSASSSSAVGEWTGARGWRSRRAPRCPPVPTAQVGGGGQGLVGACPEVGKVAVYDEGDEIIDLEVVSNPNSDGLIIHVTCKGRHL